MGEMGFKTKYSNPEVAVKLARLYFDRNNKASTEGLHVQLYVEKLQAMDPIVAQADSPIYLDSRTSVSGRSYTLEAKFVKSGSGTGSSWLVPAGAILEAVEVKR